MKNTFSNLILCLLVITGNQLFAQQIVSPAVYSSMMGGARILADQGNTAANPAIGFTGLNSPFGNDGAGGNGIFRPLANTMAFTTSSTERLRITSGGNIGIGTTSPSSKLEVNGDIRIGLAKKFLLGTNASNSMAIYNTGGINPAFAIATGNNERLRLPMNGTARLLMGGYIGDSNADPNAVNIERKIEIQNNIPVTYGASYGLTTRDSANGITALATVYSAVGTTASWSAAGTVVGVSGTASISKLNAPQGNATGLGGNFVSTYNSAAFSNNFSYYVNTGGVMGAINGTIATYPTTGTIAAVIGKDNINTSSTYAADFAGKCRGTSAWIVSDARYKTNIKPIERALDKVLQLRGVSYGFDREKYPEMNFQSGNTLGFVAQELKEVLPELVNTDANGYHSVNYDAVIPVLVEAIKEQQEQIETLKTLLSQQTNEDPELRDNSFPVTPFKYTLLQNTPNPFEGTTLISYQIQEKDQNAKLMIFDLTGKQISSYALDAQQQSISIDGHELKAGMYIYALVINGKELMSKKMIVQ